jgi:hypothetical protein
VLRRRVDALLALDRRLVGALRRRALLQQVGEGGREALDVADRLAVLAVDRPLGGDGGLRRCGCFFARSRCHQV